MGDEIWTLRAAVRQGFSYLLTHHHVPDYSIPLAMWERALIGSIGLSEWGVRLPVFVMGCAVPPLVWLFLRRAVTSIFALSPILVLYSRFGRPYIGVVLFVLLALIGWTRWLDSGERRWGALAAASVAIALFWNVLAAPALVGLFAAGFARYSAPWSRSEGAALPNLRSSAAVAVGAVLLTLLLYAPSLPSLLEVTSGRRGSGFLTPASVWGSLHFLLGTRFEFALLWALASIGLGAARLRRGCPVLLASLLAMFIGQAIAVAVIQPQLVEWSYVLGRYLLPGSLGLLILLGLGIAQQASWVAGLAGPGARGRESAAGWGLVLLVFCVGPLPGVLHSPNAFTNQPRNYARPTPQMLAERISPFYASLERTPLDRGAIVEVPWTRTFRFTPYGEYQRIHGRRVWSVTNDPLFKAPGVDLRGVRPPAALAADSIEGDYVVIHKRVTEEMMHVMPGAPGDELLRQSLYAVPKRLRRLHDETVEAALFICAGNERLQRVYEDEWLVVYANRDAPALAGEVTEGSAGPPTRGP